MTKEKHAKSDLIKLITRDIKDCTHTIRITKSTDWRNYARDRWSKPPCRH
ncbi:hypothetical protein LCGC14_3072460 [marine sediment metagenome]|uniref:Uncharacterized protein n=1 Tax=marine sediment metagenome TaxID=412755 RepID=A0A0F8WFM4_9ZZZZ